MPIVPSGNVIDVVDLEDDDEDDYDDQDGIRIDLSLAQADTGDAELMDRAMLALQQRLKDTNECIDVQDAKARTFRCFNKDNKVRIK